MKKILLSILSDHLIPNYITYKHLEAEVDEHLLISTKKTEDNGVLQNFVSLIQNKPHEVICLDDPNEYYQIYKLLQSKNIPTQEKYIVNITGGTKITSLAIFDFFTSLPNVKIVYAPIDKPILLQIYPQKDVNEAIKFTLSLEEYLRLYGYFINQSNTLYATPKKTKALFEQVAANNYNAMSVQCIRQVIKAKSNKKQEETPEQIYYCGGWFEEYIYNTLKSKLNLRDDQIALNVRIRKDKNVGAPINECDVMYVKDNKLYVVECKSSIGTKSEFKIKMEGFLYKLASLVKEMGLRVNPILAAAALLEHNDAIVKRADILKIKLLGAERYQNPILFDGLIKLM